MKAALLPDRGVVKVAGDDARKFLNGLITSDIGEVTPEHAGFVLRFCGTYLSLRHRYLGVVQNADEWAVDGGHDVAATAGLREGVVDQDKRRTISRKNRDPVT